MAEAFRELNRASPTFQEVVDTIARMDLQHIRISDPLEYAQKLSARAEFIVERDAQGLAAYVAYYNNQETAFISMVWVREDRRGRGLARTLIQRVIRLTHKDIRLEAHAANPVRWLYEGLGFSLEKQSDEILSMLRRRRVAIMQPYLFPHPGYFQLADAAELFVFYDDVKYIKRGWINRNFILGGDGPQRFSIPVRTTDQSGLISSVRLAGDARQNRKLMATLSQAYASAPYRDAVIEMVHATTNSGSDLVADSAIRSVQVVHEYLHRDFRYIRSSLTQTETRGMEKADRLIAITRRLGYRSYVNAAGGRSLYSKTAFEKAGVELNFLRSEIQSWPQGGGGFVGGLSIIDLLMWNSPEAAGEILSQYTIE